MAAKETETHNWGDGSVTASKYDEICQDNIRRRGEEFDDIGRLISEQLYSDRSHFVYELLQNAEDALERRLQEHPDNTIPCDVEFRLFQDRLEFRHFGVPFSEEDVRGVSDVLKGTKDEDIGQIGKFGIGFKSVYAFTASPEIHSGDEHFVIKRYIRPEEKLPTPDLEIKHGETVFVFPFDHADLSESKAFELIINKLRGLGPRVLLFLRRIEEILWSVKPNGEEGQYLREKTYLENSENARRVTVIGQKNGQDEEQNWLIFERQVDASASVGRVTVEVGFRIEIIAKKGLESIVRENNTPLIVYFPTERTTTLGFLIQGPYRTTPARDNILNDDQWNEKLISESAELLVDALRKLRLMGLLSVSLFEALPIKRSDFPASSIFRPVFDKVREAISSEALLPANDRTFVTAVNAKLVRGAALMKILQNEQLRELYQSEDEIRWLLDEITQDRAPLLRSYLIEEIDVEEVTPDSFARELNRSFLEKQTDEWFVEFYRYLLAQRGLWQHVRGSRIYSRRWSPAVRPLRNKPILRLQDNSHVSPFSYNGSPNAYWAAEPDTETSFPIVKMALSSDREALKFLKELGIPELDIVEEVITNVLPKYTGASVSIDVETNGQDLKKIEQANKTDSQDKKNRLRNLLRKTPFILAQSPVEGGTVYRRPGDVYFASDGLQTYFSGNRSFACISYNHQYSKLLRVLGVSSTIRIHKKKTDWNNHVIVESYHGQHRRGLNGFDPDIRIDGLDHAVSNPNLKKSAFIWNRLAIPNSSCIRGVVEESTRQTYDNSSTSEETSEFGRLLTNSAWLPDFNGRMYRPQDIALEDLPESFQRDEKLASQLGMKKNLSTLAEEAGISENVLYRAKQIEDATPEIQQQIDRLLQRATDTPSHQEEPFSYKKALSGVFSAPGVDPTKGSVLGVGTLRDPLQRRKRTQADISSAIHEEDNTGDRFNFTVRKNWESKDDRVRAAFTDWYGGRCQICGETFMQQNGKLYFEGVYLVSRTVKGWLDRVGNVLCVCAQHSAMFQFGPKEVDGDIGEQVMRLKPNAEGGQGQDSVRMTLCGEPIRITYEDRHLIDLQEMIKAS